MIGTKKAPTLVTIQRQVLELQGSLDKFLKMYMDDQKLFDDIPAIGNIAQATKDRVTKLHSEVKQEVKDSVTDAIESTIPKMEARWKFWHKKKK